VDPRQIMKRRHLALVIIRAVAILMILYGGVHVLWGLGTGFGLSGYSIPGGLQHATSVFWKEMFNPFWYGMAVLLPGVGLVIADRRLVHWLIPVPRQECPQCGYALRQLTTTRCPECGVELGPPSVSGPGQAAGQ
jgi:hypothetical protein